MVFVGGFFLWITDEAVTFFRARKNTKGTIVPGYEENLPGPGWEVVDSYQHKFECEFIRWRKQSNWENERQMKLKLQPKEQPTREPNELPVVRYQCGRSPIYFQPGMGWGLF